MLDSTPCHASFTHDADPAPAGLVSSVSTASKSSFAAEVMPHEGILFGLARRLCRSTDGAHDLVQETFIKAWRAWASFEPGTNCRAWLCRILTNTFINQHRRKVREHDILEGKDALSAEHELVHIPSKQSSLDPQTFHANKELSSTTLRALRALPVHFRQVVVLSDIEELSYKEIAARVGVPVGTVMSRLFRGRRLLQESLFAHAIEEGVLRPVLDGKGGTPMTLDDYRRRRSHKDDAHWACAF
jgi:RNA polymerase sigma-70 factor, ECF subfamily